MTYVKLHIVSVLPFYKVMIRVVSA